MTHLVVVGMGYVGIPSAALFADAERHALHGWLSGTLTRTNSHLLHTTLERLRS